MISDRPRLAVVLIVGLTPSVWAAGAPTSRPAVGRCSPVDYGAVANDGEDDSAAFQQAVDALAKLGQGELVVPAGDFHVQRRVTAELREWRISIVGAGVGVTRVFCTGDEGVFRFRGRSRGSQMTVRDLSLMAPRAGAGVALEIAMPEGGNAHHRSLIVEDVEIRGVDAATDYFDGGIRALGQWRPLFTNVVFSGPFGPKVKDRYSEDSPAYRARCGIQVDGSYAPAFQHCYVWSAQTGYSVKSQAKPNGPEDAAFHRCFVVGCRIGIDIATTAREPQLVIDSCHINCRDVGIRVANRKFFHLVNNLLYNDDFESIAPGYVDLELLNCQGGVITGNIFHQPGNRNRAMLQADKRCRDLIVAGNIFNARGTAIRVLQGAVGVTTRGNQFTGEETAVDPRYR